MKSLSNLLLCHSNPSASLPPAASQYNTHPASRQPAVLDANNLED